MITIIKERERKTETCYERRFWKGDGGYSFPCDENGNLIGGDDSRCFEICKANYGRCLQHPEKWETFNKIVKTHRHYTEPAEGVCECGEHVFLEGSYYGADECPNCHRWYNMSGQELVPPSEWEEDY